MKVFRFNALISFLILIAGLLSVGCSSISKTNDQMLTEHRVNDFLNFSKKGKRKEDDKHPQPYPNPVKMASTWQPDVLIQQGRTPTRGFGGRLFFFDEKSRVVPVAGTLTIHGFQVGENGGDSEIKPFKFSPDQFTQHYSTSDFGASYSIWIPWDAVGQFEKEISLVPTFQTIEGKVVQGSPTSVMLPGPKRQSEERVARSDWSPQYHEYRNAIAGETKRPSGLVTTTIRRSTEGPEGSLQGTELRQRMEHLAGSRQQSRGERYADVQSQQLSRRPLGPQTNQRGVFQTASAQIPAQNQPVTGPAPTNAATNAANSALPTHGQSFGVPPVQPKSPAPRRVGLGRSL